jgi:penicillin-binding protein 1A
MVGGHGFQPRVDEINMALVPRQTGSSIKLFILAAALQAGALPTDLIDGTKPCLLPNPDDPKNPFLIDDAVGRGVVALQEQTWASINCAFARLSQIVGLHRVVDTTYRMAHSPYLFEGQTDRVPLQPYASFATGANAMRPIDMAAGMQTIANQGLHHDPYYVDYIDKADGTRLYTHDDPGVQVLDPDVALTTIATLRGVLTKGTAAKTLANFPFPAAGKTGTQQDNTNSWFVGATPQLTTAVWVGDPDAYTPMVNVPEFVGVGKVQGATYPARIWGAMMEPALTQAWRIGWPLRLASRCGSTSPATSARRWSARAADAGADHDNSHNPATGGASGGGADNNDHRAEAGAEGDSQRHHNPRRRARSEVAVATGRHEGHRRISMRQTTGRRRDHR